MLGQTMLSRLYYKSVVTFLSSSGIISSSVLAASNISKQRENNSSERTAAQLEVKFAVIWAKS